MKEPSPRSSRLALAGALAVAILVGGAGFLLGRETTERTRVVISSPPIVSQAPEPAPESPSLRRLLGRSDLIALAAAAADAAAAGRDPETVIRETDGRRFELRLPFGCNGPAAENSEATMRWRYDTDDSVLRIHVAPTTWTAEDWGTEAEPSEIDAIEGFWITRPWTASEDCPAGGEPTAAAGADAVTLPGQTLALGQVFLTEGARGGRRNGKAYQAVVRVLEDELDTSNGFRLRISGRIAPSLNTAPVRCQQPAGPEQRPICLIGVLVDEIAIENPASDETLAIWNVAQRGASEN